MQPKAQITTRGILAVSAGAFEVLLQYLRRFRSGPTLTLTLTLSSLNLWKHYHERMEILIVSVDEQMNW